MNILYQPGRNISHVVKKLRRQPVLKFHDFIELSKDKPERHAQLSNYSHDLGVVYLWGSGKNHDDSYHFDTKCVDGKFNIDAHHDMNSLLFKSNDFDFACHMWMSWMDGGNTKNIISYFANGIAIPIYDFDPVIKTWDEIENIKGLSLHLTLDFDSLLGFPCERQWKTHAFMTLNDMFDLIVKIARDNTILRVDMGGVAEEFNLSKAQEHFAFGVYKEVLEFVIPLVSQDS